MHEILKNPKHSRILRIFYSIITIKKDGFWSSTFQISTFFREVMRYQDKHEVGEDCSRDGRMLKGERWDGRRHRQSWAGMSPAALIKLTGKHLNL